MSIPKKGTRKITVKAESFIWLIRKQATNNQAEHGSGFLHVAVEHAKMPGSVLIIHTNKRHSEDIGSIKTDSVKPSNVSRWILQAIEAGWQPKKAGVTFVFPSFTKTSGKDIKR